MDYHDVHNNGPCRCPKCRGISCNYNGNHAVRKGNSGKKVAVVCLLMAGIMGGLYFTNTFDLQSRVAAFLGGVDLPVMPVAPPAETLIPTENLQTDEIPADSEINEVPAVEQQSDPIVEERQLLETNALLETDVLLVGRDARVFTIIMPDEDIEYLQGSIIPERNAVVDVVFSVNNQVRPVRTIFGDASAQSAPEDNREVLLPVQGGDTVDVVVKTSEAYPSRNLSQQVRVNLYVSYKVQIKTVTPIAVTEQAVDTKEVKSASGSGRDIDPRQLALKVHDLINAKRMENGLTALSWDATLQPVAQSHSDDMAARDYFDHVTPEGKSPTDRANSAGYSCYKDYGSYYTSGIAENLFQHWTYDYITYINGIPIYSWNSMEKLATEVVEGWMQSTGHRENILTPTYDKQAIAVTIASSDKIYVTENFC